MKKVFFPLLLVLTVLMSSCGTYTATGAYTGAQFGHIIGSAIGGIGGGWRGHHTGSLIGTMGGAVAGAAIGAAIDNAHDRRVERMYGNNQPSQDDYGYYNNGGGAADDRITFDEGPATPERSFSVDELARKVPIEIRNAEVIDKDGDGMLVRGEVCNVAFEIWNNTDHTIFDLYPLVEDVTGNKHVVVSQNLRVESLLPHRGIRYTASIQADKRLKDGEIVIRVGVAKGNEVIESQTRQFTVKTAKIRK